MPAFNSVVTFSIKTGVSVGVIVSSAMSATAAVAMVAMQWFTCINIFINII